MNRKEELARAIEDLDMLENDIQSIGEELRQIEMSNTEFEKMDEWDALDREYTALINEEMYLSKIIEDLK